MIDIAPRVFGTLAAFSDPLRCRLLLLVEKRELSVAELVQCMQLPQSSISRHLKALADEGLVAARVEGASNRYSMQTATIEQPVRRLWNIVREQSAQLPAAGEDARRLAAVLSERHSRSQAYFSSAAGHWDRTRRELFGESSHLNALLALLDPGWVIGDLGTGTGHIAGAVAPFVASVFAIDESAAMLAAARRRLAGFANVELRRGELASLPLENGELDVAILHLVLPFVDDPASVLGEVRRVVRRKGRVLIVDMLPHDREDLAREMGHVWRGFSSGQLKQWGVDAGFSSFSYHELPADAAAKGPSLFAATLSRGAGAS